jgi:hypothetical protein
MLIPGAASNPWETLSSLQPLQQVNAGVPAAGIGVGQFVTDGEASSQAASGLPFTTQSPAATGQPLLSPDVLGFLIWNQSQQPGAPSAGNGTSPPATTNASSLPSTGAASGTDPSGLASWPSLPSWFPPLSASGANIDTSGATNAGATAAATATTQSNTNADPALAAGQPDAAPQSSGVHGHHHHHGGFAPQSQSNASDPLANLFGTSAQDGSSTTATNSDGSTTTTITYADGSEVTLTTPAQASNGNANATAAAAQPPLNANNFLETLIQLQARLLSLTTAA